MFIHLTGSGLFNRTVQNAKMYTNVVNPNQMILVHNNNNIIKSPYFSLLILIL